MLVVDTGESEYRMCVELPRSEVSGTDLIVLAGEQHGLSYRFGYGGGAVCMLAGVGTDGDDCFEKYPDFWGYWRGDGSGGWSWSSSGAASTRVSNGDVEGWSWGSGSDGSSHPPPPRTTFSSVCPQAAPKPSSPPPREKQTENREGSAPRQPRSRDVAPDDAAVIAPDPARGSSRDSRPATKRRARSGSGEPRRRNPRPKRSAPVAPTPTAGIDGAEQRPASATQEQGSQGGGPPPAGVAAIVAAGALGGAGTWLARRRRPRP